MYIQLYNKKFRYIIEAFTVLFKYTICQLFMYLKIMYYICLYLRSIYGCIILFHFISIK